MNLTLALRTLALVAAITATATGEYSLARHVGFDAASAVAPVVAVDAFAVAAFRAGRRADIGFAVVAMSAGTAGGHVVAADAATQGLWLIVTIVSATSPLVAWRVHALGGSTPVVARPVAPKVAPQAKPKPVQPKVQPAVQPAAIDRPSAEEARKITARLVAEHGPDVALKVIADATGRDKTQASRLRSKAVPA